jgi:nicotinamide-nucleotide amidase
MSEDEKDLDALAERVGLLLLNRGQKLATAESCTGGWVSQCITGVPGSSAWFDRGFVTYSNEAKNELLGVSEIILNEHGAVSEETVRAMAAGALQRSSADCAVALSGIAGPTGATPGKPVGMVWFAWQRRDGEPRTRLAQFDGDRRAVRRQAVAMALRGVLELYSES